MKLARLLIPLHWHGEGDPPAEPPKQPEVPPTDIPVVVEPPPATVLPPDLSKLSNEELINYVKEIHTEKDKLGGLAQERLHEIMKKKEKLKLIDEANEAKRVKELEEKEEYKKLYEEAKAKEALLTNDAAKNLAYFQGQLTSLKDALPLEYQSLVPETIGVREKIAWIENFNKTVVAKKQAEPIKPPAPPVGSSATPGDPPPVKTAEEDLRNKIAACSSQAELEKLMASIG